MYFCNYFQNCYLIGFSCKLSSLKNGTECIDNLRISEKLEMWNRRKDIRLRLIHNDNQQKWKTFTHEKLQELKNNCTQHNDKNINFELYGCCLLCGANTRALHQHHEDVDHVICRATITLSPYD